MTSAHTLARVPLRGRPLVTLAGGILGLLVAMGVGRFAFTLLLPLMQSEAGFSPRVAGWLAAANYFGYFVGSLTATFWPAGRSTRGALLGAFVVSTVTTIGMGLTQSIGLWIGLRFLSGAASAWVFVFVSTLVLTHLRDAGNAGAAGWMYGGLGIGIAVTSLLVLALPIRDSATLWILFGALSAIVLILSASALPAKPSTGAVASQTRQAAPARVHSGRGLLLLAYTLEGIGYIVSATFIVAVIHSARGNYEAGAWAWVVVGLAGIPACVLWTRRADYRTLLSRLALGYWIQASGIVAVAVAPASVIAATISAATLGATLTGIVMLTMVLAPRLDPEHPRRTVGQLTIGFSVGQMLGPVLAGYTADFTGSYGPALLGSAALLVVSALATHAMIRAESKEASRD
ncbi:MAG TPA: YbfB/YjiJ family MFS transporter [Burkholderiales bacterium]|nr:YbfB/YjiJ family MFS transporter [Burkholderiales bacterium]